MQEPNAEVERIASMVLDAAFDVHRTLGPAFKESIYEAALAIEMSRRGLIPNRQHPVQVLYRGHPVGEGRIDLFPNQVVVVELKVGVWNAPRTAAQVRSYLAATRAPLGFGLNFSQPTLKEAMTRVVLSG